MSATRIHIQDNPDTFQSHFHAHLQSCCSLPSSHFTLNRLHDPDQPKNVGPPRSRVAVLAMANHPPGSHMRNQFPQMDLAILPRYEMDGAANVRAPVSQPDGLLSRCTLKVDGGVSCSLPLFS